MFFISDDSAVDRDVIHLKASVYTINFVRYTHTTLDSHMEHQNFFLELAY